MDFILTEILEDLEIGQFAVVEEEEFVENRPDILAAGKEEFSFQLSCGKTDLNEILWQVYEAMKRKESSLHSLNDD